MKASVDPRLWASRGVCVDICREVFELGDEAATLIAEPVPAEAQEACREAAESCPVEAIIIEE